MAIKEFHIFDAVALPVGGVGMRMLGWKYSRFQAKKALRRLKPSHPSARIVVCKTPR